MKESFSYYENWHDWALGYVTQDGILVFPKFDRKLVRISKSARRLNHRGPPTKISLYAHFEEVPPGGGGGVTDPPRGMGGFGRRDGGNGPEGRGGMGGRPEGPLKSSCR